MDDEENQINDEIRDEIIDIMSGKTDKRCIDNLKSVLEDILVNSPQRSEVVGIKDIMAIGKKLLSKERIGHKPSLNKKINLNATDVYDTTKLMDKELNEELNLNKVEDGQVDRMFQHLPPRTTIKIFWSGWPEMSQRVGALLCLGIEKSQELIPKQLKGRIIETTAYSKNFLNICEEFIEEGYYIIQAIYELYNENSRFRDIYNKIDLRKFPNEVIRQTKQKFIEDYYRHIAKTISKTDSEERIDTLLMIMRKLEQNSRNAAVLFKSPKKVEEGKRVKEADMEQTDMEQTDMEGEGEEGEEWKDDIDQPQNVKMTDAQKRMAHKWALRAKTRGQYNSRGSSTELDTNLNNPKNKLFTIVNLIRKNIWDYISCRFAQHITHSTAVPPVYVPPVYSLVVLPYELTKLGGFLDKTLMQVELPSMECKKIAVVFFDYNNESRTLTFYQLDESDENIIGIPERINFKEFNPEYRDKLLKILYNLYRGTDEDQEGYIETINRNKQYMEEAKWYETVEDLDSEIEKESPPEESPPEIQKQSPQTPTTTLDSTLKLGSISKAHILLKRLRNQLATGSAKVAPAGATRSARATRSAKVAPEGGKFTRKNKIKKRRKTKRKNRKTKMRKQTKKFGKKGKRNKKTRVKK